MQIIDFGPEGAREIVEYQSRGASATALGHGAGELHVYCVYFGPDGAIGEHPAGPCQLFLVVQGSGWVSGSDGDRVPVHTGQAALFQAGERHAKGSETGMTAIMVQGTRLQPAR